MILLDKSCNKMWIDLHLSVARGHVQSGTKCLLQSRVWEAPVLCNGSTELRLLDLLSNGRGASILPQDFVGIFVAVCKLCPDGNRSRWPFQSWVASA